MSSFLNAAGTIGRVTINERIEAGRRGIVHLTRPPDQALSQVFTRVAASPRLPEYVEIYIRDDLRIPLERQPGGR